MKSSAATVSAYLASLPPDRRRAMSEVRAHVSKHLPSAARQPSAARRAAKRRPAR